MSSLPIIAAIVLHSCHLSASFSTLPTSRQHFVANTQHYEILRQQDTSLFSTAAAAIHHLDDSNMKNLLFSTPPDSPSAVLVDAYTQWCGPCKLIEPLITSTAEKYSNQLSILKYDVEGSNNQDLKVELLLQGVRVSGLPTLILYWEGEPVASHSGVISEEGLEDWLEVNLFSNNELNRQSVVGNDGGAVTKTKEVNNNSEGTDEEIATAPKRGFVSFASQYGKDDYALSSY
uniref:Thioredoxin domain-containing protein n=1 Tax=Skeletonema marinoi TaxID=267567 RepID=A0A7S2M638_9STRA